MTIFAVDDERPMLEELHEAIAEAAPGAEILDFRRASDALEAITARGVVPDVVFSDISMPGMDGLHLAVRVKTAAPNAQIVFVTGYSEYALEAWKRHVNGYLMKPVDAAAIREQLSYLSVPSSAAPKAGKLTVRCFGNFEVFWQGKPLTFGRRQTKELLAYLVDREGAYCTAGELITALWEDEADSQEAKNYLRVLTSDLTAALREIGMKDVLLRKRGLWAVNRALLDCDYYRMLRGDMQAVNAYRGEYMVQYSWAELTAARLYFKNTDEQRS